MSLGPRAKNAFFWRQRKSVGFKRLSITAHTFLHHWTWTCNQFCCFFSTNLLLSSTKVLSKYPPHPPFRVQLPFIKHLVTTVRVIISVVEITLTSAQRKFSRPIKDGCGLLICNFTLHTFWGKPPFWGFAHSGSSLLAKKNVCQNVDSVFYIS